MSGEGAEATSLLALPDALLARIVVESGGPPLVSFPADSVRALSGDVWHPKHLARAACVSKCAAAAAVEPAERSTRLQG